MKRKDVSDDAGSVKTVEEAGRRFIEELLRRFHHDRPDEQEDLAGEVVG